MCGICGTAGGRAPATRVEEALNRLRHRGPDGCLVSMTTVGHATVAFGHARLAINDLSPAGAQPMETEEGDFLMVFNGEIYNYPELARECKARGRVFRSEMDGEVILHLWALDGKRCLKRLNGIFALAIADRRSGELVIARDPLGVKPVFWTIGPDRALHFASELAALGTLAGGLGPQDVTAIAQFLTFLWIPDPRTPYRDARSVLPGEALVWRNGAISFLRYCDPFVPDDEPARISMAVAVSAGEDLIDKAVKRQLLSNVPIGLMASGGIDSSLIWWNARSTLQRAYCVEWRGDADHLEEDATAVRSCQAAFGTDTTYIPGSSSGITELGRAGDLLADPAYALTRQIAAEVTHNSGKVLLSGQGGDELFGGYRRHRIAPTLKYGRLPGALSRRLCQVLRYAPHSQTAEYAFRTLAALQCRSGLDKYLSFCSYSTAEERARALDCDVSEVSDPVVAERHASIFESLPKGLSLLRQFMTLDLQVYLPGLGLAYADRAGMEEGVEIRVPLLDLDVVRWSLSLPDHLMVKHGMGKVLTTAIADRHVPREAVHRPKRGFAVPTSTLHVLTPSERAFRQPTYFANAVRILEAHLSGRCT